MNSIESARHIVLTLCNSLKNKDWENFLSCFNTKDPGWGFIDVLPGGKLVKGSQSLIDLHPLFFQSEKTCFQPLSGTSEFESDCFLYELSWGQVCQFGVAVDVTKPEELSKDPQNPSEKFVNIQNILNLTLAFDPKSERWWLASITNTVVK